MTPVPVIAIGGHADRPVVLLETPQGMVVVKRYLSADGARIFREHRCLWASPLGTRRGTPGIPEPFSWDPRTRELMMEAIDGPPLGMRGSLGEAPRLVVASARLLADLHTCGVTLPRRRTASRIVASLGRKAGDLADDPVVRQYRETVDQLTEVAPRVAACERLVPSHGDWSPRNVLQAPAGLRMIDFDRLQMAGAGRDVAYWGAWAWATQLLAGETPDDHLAEAYDNAYLACRPSVRDELALTTGFHRAAGLLRIAHGWSALAGRPDLRRRVIAEAMRSSAERPGTP